ncbi:MAG TPA: hypothetical protein VGR59_15160 [Gemmatimonadaceae bacterium]|nr:hypothetical protein [Gemmatimonadaceae bacterium]
MGPDVLVPLSGMLMVVLICVGVPLARAHAKRMERGIDPKVLPNDLTDRLTRMEQAIDSMAVEIERISEGQRFTTKLLSERAPEALPVNRAGGVPVNAPLRAPGSSDAR